MEAQSSALNILDIFKHTLTQR